MNKLVNIKLLIKQIAELDNHSKKLLVKENIKMLDKSEKKAHPITDLKGLGKVMWKGINIENHIQTERQWE